MGAREMKRLKNSVKISVLLLLGSVALASGGCVTKGATMSRIEGKTIDTTHPRAELILGSKKLLRKIVMTNVRIGKIGQFQRAEVGLQNLQEERYSLEYRIEWQDEQGFSINSNNSWHRITLGPKQIKNLKSVGKTPEAYKIFVTVRFPDDIFIESHKIEMEERKRRR